MHRLRGLHRLKRSGLTVPGIVDPSATYSKNPQPFKVFAAGPPDQQPLAALEQQSSDRVFLPLPGWCSRRVSHAPLGYSAQLFDELGQVLNQSREIIFPLVVTFVHVKRPVDFDLQRMALRARTPIVSRREPAGVWRVDRDGKAAIDKEEAGGLDELWIAGDSVAVAEHDVGPAPFARGVGSRRHRMAIDEQTAAEQCFGLFDKPAQRPVIGPVQPFNAAPNLRETKLLRVNLFTAGDDPGDRAETHADARRSGVDEFWQSVGEHAGIELIGLAVDVDIGAREASRQQRGAEARTGREELIDKAVFGPPQRYRVEPRGGKEIGRILGTAMRRRENERKAARDRQLQIENIGLGCGLRELAVHAVSLVRARHAVTSQTPERGVLPIEPPASIDRSWMACTGRKTDRKIILRARSGKAA